MKNDTLKIKYLKTLKDLYSKGYLKKKEYRHKRKEVRS